MPLNPRLPKRVMIFIDGSNFYWLCKSIGINVKWEKFIPWLLEQFPVSVELERVYYYTAMPDPNKEPKSFKQAEKYLNYLHSQDQWEILLGKLRYYEDKPPITKGVDVKLATDMLNHAFLDNYDIALVVSGDADIGYCFNAIKTAGKKVAVAKYPEGFASELQQKADYTIQLVKNKLLRKNIWTKSKSGY